MRLIVEKSRRVLTLMDGGRAVFTCPVGLGQSPEGPKTKSGDGRTPEGAYFICLVKDPGKYGRSLGLSYPAPEDARRAFAEGRIDAGALDAVLSAHAQRRRPPWGTALGGEIYIHEGGSQSDWTQGCIALDAQDMDVVFANRDRIRIVEIRG